jgi:hypothetical protein
MKGSRKENALSFCVVFAPELRRELQKSGMFCVESSAQFRTNTWRKNKNDMTQRLVLSIVDRDPRSSFNVHRSTFDNQQPTTDNVLDKEPSLFPHTFSSTPPRPLRSFFNR